MVALGDLNADGKLDAVTANVDSNNVTVLLGDGSGGFSSGSSFAVGTNPGSVALGDLDADGRLDVVTANGGSDDVSVLVGDGSGGFSAASGSPIAVGDRPVSVALGDLNADAKLDAVVINSEASTMSVLVNTSLPVSSLSSSAVTFGSSHVNIASQARSVRVTNTGGARMSISSVRIDGVDADHFRIVDDACQGTTLGGGESCRVLVSFVPLTWGVIDSASLKITSDAPGSPQRVTLSGVGVPETRIKRGVTSGGSTQDSTPTFRFTTDDTNPGVSFECKVDKGAWAACTSPFTTAALTPGKSHKFRVRAVDPDGNSVDPTPAKRRFTVV